MESTSGRNLGHGHAAVNVLKRRKSAASSVKGEALILSICLLCNDATCDSLSAEYSVCCRLKSKK